MMNHRKWYGLTFLFSLFLCCSIAFSVIAQTPPSAETPTSSTPENCPPTLPLWDTLIQRSYQQAIQDAQEINSTEVSQNLWAISRQNSQLQWRNTGRQSKVLMVTWTGWDGYDQQIGKPMTLTQEVWVTPVPEVQQFAQSLSLDDVNIINASV